MIIVDDPLLALIVRFVVGSNDLDISDSEFIQRQIETLKLYVDRFPAEQRRERTLEWVERHAEEYRRSWQKRVAPIQLASRSCPDCPLKCRGEGHCDIHAEWLGLLKRYSSGDIGSQGYVEEALRLLQEHKDELRILVRRDADTLRQALGAAVPV